MENVVDLRINFDDNGVVKYQQTQIDLTKQQVKAFSELEKAINSVYDDAATQSQAYNNAIKENLGQLKAQDLQIKKTATSAQLYEKAVDRITDVFGQFKNGATNAINNLKSYSSGLVSSAKGATGFVRVLKLLRVALISTGIGAIVIALAGLVAAFGRTAAGGEKLAQIFKGLTATVDAVIGRFATVGNAIIGLFNGTKTLSQATKEAAGAFNGLGKEMRAAFTEGQRIEKIYQQLEKSARQLSVDESQVAKRVAYLQSIAEREGVSAGKAINAISAARKAEIDITDLKIEQQEKLLKNIQDEVKQTGRLGAGKDLLDKEAEARIELNNLETDRINLAAEYAGRVAQIREQQRREYEERQDQLKKLKDEYNKLLGDLEKRLDKATITGEDGIEKLLAQRDVAIQELVDFQKSLEDAAKKAGVKLPEATKQQITSLYAEVEDEFVRQAIEFRKKNPFSIETFLSFEEKTKLDAAQKLGDEVVGLLNIGQKESIRDIQKLGTKLGNDVAENVQRGLNDADLNSRPIFQKIKDGLLSAFNVNEEELGLITDLIGDSISQIDDIILAGTQRQIAENDALIASIEKRVSAAQEAYDAELKLQQDGVANSAKIKEDELKAEQARLQRANEQKEALEKKALRQQLISDSLAQASQLALAAAKVVSSESSKGLLGILTAASGIALLFRIIAQARANAVKFSAPQKFRKGGELLKGPSHEDGGIPIVIGGARVVEAEGGEMIVSRKNTAPNIRFLHNLNKGQYQGVDLLTIAEQAKRGGYTAQGFGRMASNGAQVSRKLIEHESKMTERVIEKAVDRMREELVRETKATRAAIERRPVVTPVGESYKKEWVDGNIKNVQIVHPKG